MSRAISASMLEEQHGTHQNKRIRKPDILIAARKYIERLEARKEMLEKERRILKIIDSEKERRMLEIIDNEKGTI